MLSRALGRVFCRRLATKGTPELPSKIWNVAVIAHVDHGKTTLVDKLLKQGGLQFSADRVMDKNDIEKERGITILSKVTRLSLPQGILNIIDTPGHADFGGEVERILSMVDGVCLIVDLLEGPKTQTKFVLKKALLNERIVPIVVLNKADRPNQRSAGECENEIFDLFVNTDASDAQLEYSVLYASAKEGWCVPTIEETRNIPEEKAKGMECLLTQIQNQVPNPIEKDVEKPFKMLATLLDHVDSELLVTGKVYEGWVAEGTKDLLYIKSRDGKRKGSCKLKHVYVMNGSERIIHPAIGAGDIGILSFTGFPSIVPTDTISIDPDCEPLLSPPIDPPVVVVEISPNSSPLAGQDGSLITLAALQERLQKEAIVNVAIEVLPNESRTGFQVKGRGELQLGILIETLRREGFEMSISPPSVLYTTDEQGVILEPWETVSIDIPSDVTAEVIEKMSARGSSMLSMDPQDDRTVLTFTCSSRNLIGIRPFLRECSKNTAVILSDFLEHRPKSSTAVAVRNGVVISSAQGVCTEYGLDMIQNKGTLLVPTGTPCYPGMLLAESNTDKEEVMNPVKVKPPSNFRGKITDYYNLNVRPMNVEQCLAFVEEDEIVEVTPKRIVMRKRILDPDERKLYRRKMASGKGLDQVGQQFRNRS